VRATRSSQQNVGGCVVRIAVHGAVRDGYGAISAHGKDPQELLEVRAIILVVPVLDGERVAPGLGSAIRVRVGTCEGDGGGVVVELLQVNIEGADRAENQVREETAAVGMMEAIEGAADTIIIQECTFAWGETKGARIQPCCPRLQGVKGSVLQDEVADDDPNGACVRQADTLVTVRQEALEEGVEVEACNDVVDDGEAAEVFGNEGGVAQVGWWVGGHEAPSFA